MNGDEVRATAPTRIDLAGGTVDIWPLYLFGTAHKDIKPATLNMAISIRVHATVTRRGDRKIRLVAEDQKKRLTFPSLRKVRHDHLLGLHSRLAVHFLKEGEGVTITTRSEAPAGAGIAGSSALNIALLTALATFADKGLSKKQKLEIAKDVEAAHLSVPTGLQDYGAALYGGVNLFDFGPGGMRRQTITGAGRWLADRILLFYSGQSRNSGVNNWEFYKRMIEGDRRIRTGFDTICQASGDAVRALEKRDEAAFAAALTNDYRARLKLFPGITTTPIDRAMAAGKKAGALGGRICGAGGGGCFIVVAGKDKRKAVSQAVEATGARRLDYAVAHRGASLSDSQKR